jgi:hypothetical protein
VRRGGALPDSEETFEQGWKIGRVRSQPFDSEARIEATSFLQGRLRLHHLIFERIGGWDSSTHTRIRAERFLSNFAYPEMIGRFSIHGWHASKAAAAETTVRSAKCRPMICRPTGRPSSVQPAGTLAAGWPVRFAG